MERKSIKRKRNVRNEKNTDAHAIYAETNKVVTAEEMAKACKEKGIDPTSLQFICPGRSRTTGERCRATLTLCSAHEANVREPYFAYRGRGRDHIEYCDCAGDYRTLIISRTVDRSIERLDVNLFFNRYISGASRTTGGTTGGGNGGKSGNHHNGRNPRGGADTTIRFVSPSGLIDLYEILAMGVAKGDGHNTASGISPENLIINSSTIMKYRKNELELTGFKLAVVSNKRIAEEEAKNIRKKIADAFWIVTDPFRTDYDDDDNSNKKIIYALCSSEKGTIKKYIDKVLPNIGEKDLMLLFGNFGGIVYEDDDYIVCKIAIINQSGKQMVKLKDKNNLEDSTELE